MKKRITYFDGIKGLACIMVAAMHFNALFGATFWGTDVLAAKSEWFYNGTVCVRLFFLVSAFLLATRVYQSYNEKTVPTMVVKRYLRLALPLLAVTLCIWIMEQCGVFHNMELTDICADPDYTGGYTEKHAFYQVFTTSLGTTVFNGECSFNNKFWMMTWMFYGDLYALLVATMTRCRKQVAIVLLAVTTVMTLFTIQNLFPFALGTILAYWYVNRGSRECAQDGETDSRKKNILNGIVWTIVLLVGLLVVEFGGYFVVAFAGVAEEFAFLSSRNVYNAIGLLFIILAIMKLTYMQKILGFWPFRKLGGISYYVYLLHWPIMCSLSSWAFIHFRGMLDDVNLARVIFTISMIVICLLSWVFTVTYERVCHKVTEAVCRKI